MRRKRLIVALLALVFVGGCQDRTGIDWLDPMVVRDFDDRVALTKALDLNKPLSGRRFTYCDYGCDHVCLIVPEPSIYRDLDEENRKDMRKVRDRAERSGLVFDVQEYSGIIYDPRIPPDLSPEEIAPAKLKCLQRQREHINRIETLLDRLSRSDR